MSITADEAADIAAWVIRYRPERAHLLREYTGELDPDEEPYGDLANYHHPRHRWPLWKRTARALYLAWKGSHA